MVNDLDPRTVHLRDPGSGLKRPALVLILVLAFLALCGVAFAASGGASKKRVVDDGVVNPIPAFPCEGKGKMMEAGFNRAGP